jgi:nucleoside 2-deoxyribosyltransferase
MNRPRVYLAGKMDGLTRAQMGFWRGQAKRILEGCGFDCLDPTALSSCNYKPSDREIVDNNKFHIRNCTIVLAELDHEEASIGTIGEIIFARELGKPVIAWGTAKRVINNPWVTEHTTIICEDMGDAVDYIITNYGL